MSYRTSFKQSTDGIIGNTFTTSHHDLRKNVSQLQYINCVPRSVCKPWKAAHNIRRVCVRRCHPKRYYFAQYRLDCTDCYTKMSIAGRGKEPDAVTEDERTQVGRQLGNGIELLAREHNARICSEIRAQIIREHHTSGDTQSTHVSLAAYQC